jgi:tRNA-dihydrouridine synthase
MLLWLAPMDGITDCPYRLLVEDIFEKYKNPNDTLWTRTEFMSADGYMINPSRLIKHLIKTETEKNLIAQIYWGNRDTLITTAQDIEAKYPSFAGIELNIGCPSPKVMSCGAGAGMMKDKKRTLDIIKELSQATVLPFSIKTRLWLNQSDREDQYKFILEASHYCKTIAVHGRVFTQGHTGEVDRQTLYRLRQDINPNCILIGNGWITNYEDAVKNSKPITQNSECKELWIMIGQAAIGNPWVFTPHIPTKEERLQTCIDHLYLMAGYEIYLDHTRKQFPEISDQLMINRQHLHMVKKYDPNSDEISDMPHLDRHDYLFPMPNRDLLVEYARKIKKESEIWQHIVDFDTFTRDTDHLRTGIDIRKYLFSYIQWIPNNKLIKQEIIKTKKLKDIVSIIQSFQ